MKRILILILLCNVGLYAQTDWERWEAKEVSYQSNAAENHEHEYVSGGSGFILSALKGTYSFFISDLDGDNCPFSPTCSGFFIQSVQKTNIITGALMFADRFVRDSNLFKSRNQYKLVIHNHLYDPVENYLLKTESVKFNFEK
ncbi:MAG: membrane protein insertion efficiency factor YidD [Melioribacteraceae bacterium]|nr:membrane protein insertion efficiency factor YidD [Melioribacteraceae bacterium]